MPSLSLSVLLKCAGISCLSVFALAKLHQVVAGEQALQTLDIEITQSVNPTRSNQRSADMQPNITEQIKSPDMADWSDARKRAWKEEGVPSVLLGKLSIGALDVNAALFDGDSELHLNKGVARVAGSAALGGDGNLVIAGHRDSFFRKLGRLKAGDEIRIVGADGKQYRYQMTQHWIVTPEDTWVMADVSAPVLTLITCYPFYFVGSAPKRYIVRAKLML